MDTSMITQDVTLAVFLSVGGVLGSFVSGYLVYLCARDPDRIRRRFARYFLDTPLSDAYIRRRLFPRYLGDSIFLITLPIIVLLAFLETPLWWCPFAIGMVVLVVSMLNIW